VPLFTSGGLGFRLGLVSSGLGLWNLGLNNSVLFTSVVYVEAKWCRGRSLY